jgi:uncharacterized RDD family membrane protein YckC
LEHNPYAAPTVDVADAPAVADQQELAGKGRRFLNLIIDSFCYYIALMVLIVAMAIVDPSMIRTVVDNFVVRTVLSVSVMFCYYVAFEALFGRTLGKLLTGTRVVAASGGRPKFRQILGRTLSRVVPFEPFSCLSDPPIGWHDQWSGTRVVRTTPGNTRGAAYALHGSADTPSSASGTLGLR